MSLQEVSSEPQQAPKLPPSLPYPNSSLSYWHRTTRAFPYLNINKSNPLPASAQYVIVGSGISGALTAFDLLEAGISPEEVLILEAREAVSGSSGRNAGHVRPEAFRNFSGYAAAHGVEQALKIMENEKAVLELVNKFVHDHDVPCDFSFQTTFDVCLTQQIAEDEVNNIKQYEEAGGSIDHVKFYKGSDAVEKTGVHDALTAWEWPAASIHPAKLAQWLLSNICERGGKLWTHCPVTSITRGIGDEWKVHTPRGTISSQKVIHCTNAYAGNLLPQLSTSLLTPMSIQVLSLVPTDAFSGKHILQNTMALRYELGRFYGLVQMKSDGMLIFSVGMPKPSGITFDDSSFDKEMVGEAVEQFGTLFPNSQESKPKHGQGLDHAWTGLIAITPDKVPYVGAIDHLPGQYICAGFNGHGMAGIFTCAPAVVKLMLGETWSDTKLPECFQYSHERLLEGQRSS